MSYWYSKVISFWFCFCCQTRKSFKKALVAFEVFLLSKTHHLLCQYFIHFKFMLRWKELKASLSMNSQKDLNEITVNVQFFLFTCLLRPSPHSGCLSWILTVNVYFEFTVLLGVTRRKALSKTCPQEQALYWVPQTIL